MSKNQQALWARHNGAIRAFVEGLAEGFAAEPTRAYTGREVETLLRANLDLADAQNDNFDDAPIPEDPPGAERPSSPA